MEEKQNSVVRLNEALARLGGTFLGKYHIRHLLAGRYPVLQDGAPWHYSENHSKQAYLAAELRDAISVQKQEWPHEQ